MLTNKIHLSGSQTRDLYDLIEIQEAALQKIAQEEKEDKANLLASIYEYVLGSK